MSITSERQSQSSYTKRNVHRRIGYSERSVCIECFICEKTSYIFYFPMCLLLFFVKNQLSFKNEIATCLCMGYTNENIPKAIFFLHHFLSLLTVLVFMVCRLLRLLLRASVKSLPSATTL